MPLQSRQFKGDRKLEACLVSDPDHVMFGATGPHVGKIQQALIILGAGTISQAELSKQFYGKSTSECVLNFKGPPRNIINYAYEKKPDPIVGKRTIEALDKEMFSFENRKSPPPTPFSPFVSVTRYGEPHDHDKCPTPPRVTVPWTDGRAQHFMTPIFPQRTGLMINIWGEGETDYLGFKDYATFYGNFTDRSRPLTQTLPPRSVSDIFIRSSPLHKVTARQMRNIAAPGCRFTFSVNEGSGMTGANVIRFMTSMGGIIYHESIPDPEGLPKGMEVFVVRCDPSRNWDVDALTEDPDERGW